VKYFGLEKILGTRFGCNDSPQRSSPVSVRSSVIMSTAQEHSTPRTCPALPRPGTGALLVIALFLLAGCANVERHSLSPERARQIGEVTVWRTFAPSRELEENILALNPDHVTEADVRNVLSSCPAPRVVNIHGGIHPVQFHMVSFSQFLMGMGYPGVSITNPGDGTYSFSCYEDAEKIAGCLAWFYEHEAMRPMLVGHSQGGMQAVKVLHKLAGGSGARMHVWNPLTWECEERCEITDPLTGTARPVVGLRLCYVTAVGAGGMTRFLPNQWDVNLRLREIPDTVEEFTGFCKGADLLGGDMLGYGGLNEYKASGAARVRNVWLPREYRHGKIPDTRHLLQNPPMCEWINNYTPSSKPNVELALDAKFDGDSRHILWAADVWFSIKKHWVLELQNLIRARRAQHDAR
jgi:hypothetical protein